VLTALPATAQTPPPLANNAYAIELFQGPILAPIHVIGVGGAYVASAEGTEGSAVNAASPAVRDPYSAHWFDYDVSVGATLLGAFSGTDFDNHGDFASLPNHALAGDFIDVNLGGTLKFGPTGFATTGDLQQYSLSSGAPDSPALTMQIGRWKALGAFTVLGGHLAVGGGVRILTLQIFQRGGGTVLTMSGLGPELGALVMPTGQQWRVGLTVRAPVIGGVFRSGDVSIGPDGVRSAGSFVLPSRVDMPWEVEVGAAYQLGPRPLNPGWLDPHDQEAPLRAEIEHARADRARRRATELARLASGERAARGRELDDPERAIRAAEDERLDADSQRLHEVRKARYGNWPRERILLLASARIAGASASAVSLEGFLDQRVETVGRSATVTPSFGVEGEPLRDRMLVRVGTYVEPSRYEGGTPRQHFTFGADLRLFAFTAWGLFPDDASVKITTVLDVAPRYTNSGIAIGFWH
jgi:hypothetical protein